MKSGLISTQKSKSNTTICASLLILHGNDHISYKKSTIMELIHLVPPFNNTIYFQCSAKKIKTLSKIVCLNSK